MDTVQPKQNYEQSLRDERVDFNIDNQTRLGSSPEINNEFNQQTTTHKTQDEIKEEPKTGFAKFIDIAKKYAAVIDSRESLTRIFLEFVGFDIPSIASAATRNKIFLIETIYEAFTGFLSFALAPFLTNAMAKLTGKLLLPPEERDEARKLVHFYRHELESEEAFKKGRARILAEEPGDKRRVAELYRSMGKHKAAENYETQAQEYEDYFSNLEYSQEKIERIRNLKEVAISGESAVEGFFWGSFGLMVRWFRAKVLKQARFTGTNKYIDEKTAKELGEAKPLAGWQRFGCWLMSIISPILNYTTMRTHRDSNKEGGPKILKLLNKQLDMFHGVFPKLGLMFTYTTLPKWISTFISAQGVDELIERLLKASTVIPSWWFGHRFINGTLAKFADKKLAEKHGIERGTLVENPDQAGLGGTFPEPAKIHQVLEKTKDNQALRKEAKDLHSKIFFGGTLIHSGFLFTLLLAINKFTKWRVLRKKAKLAQ